MSATIHYHADYAAQGGPGFSGPTIPVSDLVDETNGTMAMLYSHDLKAWVIADSMGNVYVAATTPADLLPWFTEYTKSLTDALDLEAMEMEDGE